MERRDQNSTSSVFRLVVSEGSWGGKERRTRPAGKELSRAAGRYEVRRLSLPSKAGITPSSTSLVSLGCPASGGWILVAPLGDF